MIEVETFTGAAHWACYLINGDESGLEPRDVALADKWQAGLGDFYVVGVADDDDGEPQEGRFTWSYDVHTGDDCRGGDVIDYVCLRHAG